MTITRQATTKTRTRVQTIIKGPVVEGKTDPVIARMIKDVDRALAHNLLDTWRKLLRAKVKRWTGAYAKGMRVVETPKTFRVDDSRSVYGPWLEGTSRRNQTTRFKGYTAQRRAAQQIDKEAKGTAERVVHGHMGELE